MSNTNLCIRKMDAADISIVTEIHLESFPNSRSSKLGKPFLRRMYHWYILRQPTLSLIAILHSDIVGFVTGTFGWGGARRRFRYTFWQILLGIVRHPTLLFSAEIFDKWENFLRGLLPDPNRGTSQPDARGAKVTLDSIAVHPIARGRNVGMELVNAFEHAASERGAGYLALGVESNNFAARHLYENCGWELVLNDEKNNSANYRKPL